jgi:hydrogenase nickel incorporation protein HypA/HybF
MHELSIALNIIDIASAEAKQHGGGIVRAIHIKLGPLSGVVKEALISAFDLAREQSPVASADLVIEETPILVDCPHCKTQQPALSIQSLICSVCSTPASKITGGRELDITALEMET